MLTAALASIAVAGCGTATNSDPSTLLKETFSGSHPVNSGNLSFKLSVQPKGSSTLTGPITLSFGGPFQSMGKGKLPQSNFTVSVSAAGHSGSLGILSTGTAGYVSLGGTSYQLPPATFQRLESSFAQLASSPTSTSGSGTLGRLGINPLHWLTNASVAGNENVAGTNTTHIHAAINVAALLQDLSTFLGKASSLGITGAGKVPTSISPATRSRIASEVQNPSFDVWTGADDKTVRKLAIALTLPVTGQISTLLGGLSQAVISFTLQYADLNKPQTIVAPTTVAPYAQFQQKLAGFLQALQGLESGALPSGSTGSSGTGGSSATSSAVTQYSQCIQAAGTDVTKMQKCAPLLSSGG